MTDGRPTVMMTTPGITEPNMTRHPLGFESEMSIGDDQTNPYRSVQEREETERLREKQERRRDDRLFKTMQGTKDLNDDVSNPVGGDSDPFLFDDIGTFNLPSFDLGDGPQF